jgi:hypothetical protein
MATTLTRAQSKSSLSWSLEKDPPYGTATLKSEDNDSVTRSYSATGTAPIGVANVQHREKIVLAGAATYTLDLTPILDDFGGSQACARVWDIEIRLLNSTDDATSTSDRISYGGTGSTWAGYTDTPTAKMYVPAGGHHHLNGGVSGNGYPVVATTGDSLKFTNEHATNQAVVLVTLIGKGT